MPEADLVVLIPDHLQLSLTKILVRWTAIMSDHRKRCLIPPIATRLARPSVGRQRPGSSTSIPFAHSTIAKVIEQAAIEARTCPAGRSSVI